MKTTLPWILTWVFRKTLILFFLFTLTQLLPSEVAAQAVVTTGKSYVNLSRPNGGTFLPGDTLEIRATIAVVGGDNTNNTTRVNSVRYNDTINLAKFAYIPNSLVMQTNEGRRYIPGVAPAFTDLPDTDSAHINTTTGQIRFTIGNGAGASNVTTQGTSATNAGTLWGNNYMRPSFFGNTCIRVYAYRVKIINITTVVDIDSVIRLNAGNFRYVLGASTIDSISRFSPYTIRISPDYGLCSNSIGTNAILGESGGTFGSGAAQNRAGGTTFVPPPYTFKVFAAGTPNDNFYGLANRTSADGTTNPNVPYSSGAGSASRVFNVWDIIGDHTGAVNPILGNPPTNLGYTVVVNASYETNRAFTQTITGLCENTYYEFSAWFRNVCRRCSCDSSGKGATTTNFVPARDTLGTLRDSSGVKPNLSFQINGEEYYTSGNLLYTGHWIKKGFVYRTKPGQVAMTVTIRNNAPGGGGNDWAIDDIAVSTCLPNMKYSPSLTPNVCRNNALTIYDTVRSYFNNYVYYKWQRSTDGGTIWADVGAPFGPVLPGPNPNLHAIATGWEYVASYTVPPALTNPINSGDKYRLVVATSILNLSDLNCRSTDATNTVTLTIITCGPVLNVNLLSFTGKLDNNKAKLTWTTSSEYEDIYFDVEKSVDGSNFATIGTMKNNNSGNEFNTYSFDDPTEVSLKVYYRIKLRTIDDRSTYSRVLQFSLSADKFSLGSVINPFSNMLYFDVSVPKAGPVNAELINQSGTTTRMKSLDAKEGGNQFFFENTHSLTPGMYILKVEMNGVVLYKKVMKSAN